MSDIKKLTELCAVDASEKVVVMGLNNHLKTARNIPGYTTTLYANIKSVGSPQEGASAHPVRAVYGTIDPNAETSKAYVNKDGGKITVSVVVPPELAERLELVSQQFLNVLKTQDLTETEALGKVLELFNAGLPDFIVEQIKEFVEKADEAESGVKLRELDNLPLLTTNDKGQQIFKLTCYDDTPVHRYNKDGGMDQNISLLPRGQIKATVNLIAAPVDPSVKFQATNGKVGMGLTFKAAGLILHATRNESQQPDPLAAMMMASLGGGASGIEGNPPPAKKPKTSLADLL
eukprot:COSAG03_NODE_1935_length_3337_cov_1.810686_3_plen_290_part_00